MFGLGAILPMIIVFLAIFVMPDSPRWLLMKGRQDEARRVLKELLYPPPDTDALDEMVADIRDKIATEAQTTADAAAVGWTSFWLVPSIKRMLLVGVGIAVAQQLVGIDAIQYFLVFILDEAGIHSRTEQTLVLIKLGLVKLGCLFVAARLFDTRGRRTLLFVSLGGMTVALCLLSFHFSKTADSSSSSNSGSFAAYALAAYLAFFSLGMGPGAWLIPSEVFSTAIRAKAMAVATTTNRIAAAFMSSTFLTAARVLTWPGFFAVLALVCVFVAILVYAFVPETKGRSLEDTALYFATITRDEQILQLEKQLQLVVAERRERERQEQTSVARTSNTTAVDEGIFVSQHPTATID